MSSVKFDLTVTAKILNMQSDTCINKTRGRDIETGTHVNGIYLTCEKRQVLKKNKNEKSHFAETKIRKVAGGEVVNESNETAFPLHKLWNTVLKTQDYAVARSNSICDNASNNARNKNTCQTDISKLNKKITEMIKTNLAVRKKMMMSIGGNGSLERTR